jgi:hypothetical protein
VTRKRGRQNTLSLAAASTVRWLMPISAHSGIIGMQGQPPLAKSAANDVIAAASSVTINPQEILHFQLFMPKPREDYTLRIHDISLVSRATMQTRAFVDRYGQFIGAEWPGKIHSDSELKDTLRTEQDFLKANPPLPHYSRFGGWKNGPRQEATGRFAVKKISGKWWFIDPDGYLFWSSGTTGVRVEGNATTVSGREFCFAWLPQSDDPLSRFYSTGKNRTIDFFQANLQRKYGPDFEERFYRTSVQRLHALGMNTIANWSDEKICRMRRIPYVMPVNAQTPRFVASTFLKAGLAKRKYFPDPFHPDYAPAVARQLQRMEGCIGDPWLLGVFVDNELPWTERPPSGEGPWVRISVTALCANGADTPIKQALVAELKRRYALPEELNAAWGTDFSTWDAVLEASVLSAEQIRRAEKDMLALEALIAECYFQRTRDALKQCDPAVLYLGPRFCGRFTPEVVAIAAKYCDVLSFNIYEYLPDMRKADELALAHDFPVVIGEFHFGALDRGMFHTGLRKADDQRDRARKYVDYVEAGARAPWCVGAHWFQYRDQPLTGRGDGENYNIGFITETDALYPEMSDAARKMHTGLYDLRYSGE